MLVVTEPQPDPLCPSSLGRTLIIVSGRKRTGKETVYKAITPLVEGAAEFQFATPLKRFCIDVLGLSEDQCYGPDISRETPTKYRWADGGVSSHQICLQYGKEPGTIMTAREVLQVVGTDLLREGLYKNVWAEAGIRAAVISDALTCVFTDARFPNELTAHKFFPDDFKKTILIRLYRETGFQDSHKSETALDSWDVIPNMRGINGHEQQLLQHGYMSLSGDNTCWFLENPSEERFDYLLDNNGELTQLEYYVKQILIKEGIIRGDTL